MNKPFHRIHKKISSVVLRMMDEALLGYYQEKAGALPGVKAMLEPACELGIPCPAVTSSPTKWRTTSPRT